MVKKQRASCQSPSPLITVQNAMRHLEKLPSRKNYNQLTKIPKEKENFKIKSSVLDYYKKKTINYTEVLEI